MFWTLVINYYEVAMATNKDTFQALTFFDQAFEKFVFSW